MRSQTQAKVQSTHAPNRYDCSLNSLLQKFHAFPWQVLADKDLPAKSKYHFDFMLDNEEFARGYIYVPQNTAYDTKKCFKLFTNLTSARNLVYLDTPVTDLDNILVSPNKEEVCKWLC